VPKGVDCGIPDCANDHPDQCGCQPGAEQECNDRCVVGHRACGEGGEWGACEGDIDCEDPDCAARYEICQGRDGCEEGNARSCRVPDEPGEAGYEICRDERWEECERACEEDGGAGGNQHCAYPCCDDDEQLMCFGENICGLPCHCRPDGDDE